MKEVVNVKLENEMDLILAHKRAMKLCELTGFSLIAQTTLATAISEIARCAIGHGTNAVMILGIEVAAGKKYLQAVVRDRVDFTVHSYEACSYAKRLVDDIITECGTKESSIILKQQLSFSGTLTEAKIDSFIDYFKNEPPLSAYDELRRKNMMLQDLAEKLKEGEDNYRILTDSLPLMMFAVNNRGVITYTNKWLQDFLGSIPKELNNTSWQNFVHPRDYPLFNKELSRSVLKRKAMNGQYRLREKSSGNFIWHMISVIPLKNERDIVSQWIGFIVDINAQKVVEQTQKDNRELKQTQRDLYQNQEELQQKIKELNRSNYELEQFAHLASHDLQEPLRKLFFYTDLIKRKYSSVIDESGQNTLNNMSLAAGRMKELITDLLNYSQLQQQQLQFEQADLNVIVQEVIRDLEVNIKEKRAIIDSDGLPTIDGNILRLRQLFTNLISNALKYSRKEIPPHILITTSLDNGKVAIKVEDNGIGFEEEYNERIFGLFERLHTKDQIPGTGIGLSICKRIAELHNGTISATSKPLEYTIFEIILPAQQNANNG